MYEIIIQELIVNFFNNKPPVRLESWQSPISSHKYKIRVSSGTDSLLELWLRLHKLFPLDNKKVKSYIKSRKGIMCIVKINKAFPFIGCTIITCGAWNN